jgi:hypothetical protein
MAFGLSLLITVTGERPALGPNLFTAELGVAAASLILFADNLRRCV